MKQPRINLILALALAGGLGALAQTNNKIPGPADTAAFSRFVTDRNIFNPNREPHYTSQARPKTVRTHSPSAPAFTLVGTMSYEKGLFAFFSGNSAELKKVLPVSEKIAGYTVTEVAQGRATLESADKKQKLTLKVGDGMRQENGKWQWFGAGELPAGASDTGGASASDSPAAPSSAGEPNDILKRLMQLREKENK